MKEQSRDILITTALMQLNVANSCDKTSDEIRVYYEAIVPDMARFSPRTILAAIKEHMRTNKWWPKLPELIELCNTVAAQLEYERQLQTAKLEMPEKLSNRQRLKNLQGIRMVRQRLAEKRSMPA